MITPGPRHHQPHRHIMVVDDRAEVGEVVRMGLEEIGHYRVSTAASGDAALPLLDGDPPDLVVLDAILPGMSGIEFAVHVVRRDIPVLVMTGEAGMHARLESAGWPHLRKPFHLRDLVAEVEATIAAHEENTRRIRASLERLFQTSGDLQAVLRELAELRRLITDTVARSGALAARDHDGNVH